jgi:hypothetical protein
LELGVASREAEVDVRIELVVVEGVKALLVVYALASQLGGEGADVRPKGRDAAEHGAGHVQHPYDVGLRLGAGLGHIQADGDRVARGHHQREHGLDQLQRGIGRCPDGQQAGEGGQAGQEDERPGKAHV